MKPTIPWCQRFIHCSGERAPKQCGGNKGCVLLGLFQNRITQNRRYLCSFGRFFWTVFVFRFRNERNIIPFILLSIAE